MSSECPGETAQTHPSCRCSHNRLVCFINACISNSFGNFMPEEDADFSSISEYILHLLKRKKIWKTFKMYMKVLIFIISRIRNLILAFKGQIINLLSIIMCFDNVSNKQSALSFSKLTLSIFQLKSDC